MYSLLPFPLFTQIYANYVRLGVQRVSLKCQLFIEGTCAVCVYCFCCATTREKNPKKKTNQNQKKQLRAHATFTKASNTPKNKVNKREKVWKIIIILIKQREKGRKRKKKREREIVKQISDEWKKKEPTKWWAQCHPGTYTTAFRTIHINLNNNTKASSNN